MSEISKEFDGVLWEWKGRRDIRYLKPICPKCKYELDIEMGMVGDVKKNKLDDGSMRITIPLPQVTYLCSKCNFTSATNIDVVNNVEDFRKVILREFEHRIRIQNNKESK
jgi:hypothetical protein